jgi:hypothetical protein
MVLDKCAARTSLVFLPGMCLGSNSFKAFRQGIIVKAIVTSGKKVGTYLGRVAVRSTGSFNLSTANGLVQGISHKYCKPIHKKDGYAYDFAHGH